MALDGTSEGREQVQANDPWQDQPHQVVLCNFGGPTNADEVRPFLTELFLDPLIIRAPLGPMRPLLANRIAKKRAPNSTEEYAKIGFSPINKYTDIQAQQLEARLQKHRPNTKVLVCNRYTEPFATTVVPKLNQEARIFVITLYPHFCHSTTATSLKAFDDAVRELRGQNHLTTYKIYTWWQNEKYLNYTWLKLRDALDEAIKTGEKLTVLCSAHGIPRKYYDKGDPYVNESYGHFHELKRRGEAYLAEQGIDECHWELTFQSRVGPVEWIKPYTEDRVVELGKSRGGTLVMVPISFTSDHIETLYEMDVTYQDDAKGAGYKNYIRAKPANEDDEFTACLEDILLGHGFA